MLSGQCFCFCFPLLTLFLLILQQRRSLTKSVKINAARQFAISHSLKQLQLHMPITWQAKATLATLAQPDYPLVIAQRRKGCFVAENTERGQRSLDEVMVGWKASKGHYKNMTHKKAREFG